MAAATIDNPAPIAEATQKSTIVLADVLAAFKAAGHDAGDGADVYCYDGNALPHSTFWAHKNGSEHVVYVQAGNKTPPIEWTASGAAKVLYGTIGFVALPDLRTDNPPTVFGYTGTTFSLAATLPTPQRFLLHCSVMSYSASLRATCI